MIKETIGRCHIVVITMLYYLSRHVALYLCESLYKTTREQACGDILLHWQIKLMCQKEFITMTS